VGKSPLPHSISHVVGREWPLLCSRASQPWLCDWVVCVRERGKAGIRGVGWIQANEMHRDFHWGYRREFFFPFLWSLWMACTSLSLPLGEPAQRRRWHTYLGPKNLQDFTDLKMDAINLSPRPFLHSFQFCETTNSSLFFKVFPPFCWVYLI
jgi:hypothetical protein